MRTAALITLLLFCFLSVAMFFVYLRENQGMSDNRSVTLPTLLGSDEEFNLAQISSNGRPFVINVFASWCTTCLEEHATWKTVAEETAIDLYGIAYVDVEHSTLAWLEQYGNPYKIVAADYSGLMAKALGVTGVPETFVFDRDGSLVLRISGVVTPEFWKERIAGLLA
ncbi:redoxin family protein [Anaplasma platys]|uniref:redoxin family protein n=1 Tax=Anaplasma platys TaxID=949 RepID=UPI00145D7D76|nr:redoxin family protein [Anaplasma platys]